MTGSKENRCKVFGLCALFVLLIICNLRATHTPPAADLKQVTQSLLPGGNTQQCLPHQHIYFLKVHKAASTTTYNIFARFGLVKNLNVMTLFGRHRSYPFRHFDEYLPASPQRLDNGKYDIYCEHSVYDEEYLLTKLHNDTVNVAIVREPMSYLRSAFLHYKLSGKLKLDHYGDPLAEFLQQPLVYSKKYPLVLEYTRNRVSREFGYKGEDSAVEEYLNYLDSRFLVLVLDRFLESLVVMKRKLCWSMKDILHAHARKQNYKAPKANRTLMALHQAWSPLDYAFYDFFSHRMEQLIREQTYDFQGEVRLFERYLEDTNDFCDSVCARMGSLIATRADDNFLLSIIKDIRHFPASRWDRGFNVTGIDCLAMRYDPYIYREAQKVRLFPDYCTRATNIITKEKINRNYCDRTLLYGLPRYILKNPKFVSSCF